MFCLNWYVAVMSKDILIQQTEIEGSDGTMWMEYRDSVDKTAIKKAMRLGLEMRPVTGRIIIKVVRVKVFCQKTTLIKTTLIMNTILVFFSFGFLFSKKIEEKFFESRK